MEAQLLSDVHLKELVIKAMEEDKLAVVYFHSALLVDMLLKMCSIGEV